MRRRFLALALLVALVAAVLMPATGPVVTKKEGIQAWLGELETSVRSALFLSPNQLMTSTSTAPLSIDFRKLASVPLHEGWPNEWPMPAEARAFLEENFPDLVRDLVASRKELWFLGVLAWEEVVNISEDTGMEIGRVTELLQVFAELLTRAFPDKKVTIFGEPPLEAMAAYSSSFRVQDGQRMDQMVQELNNGTIPNALRDAFSANELPLSSQASVEVATPGAEWWIADPVQEREFFLHLEDGTLNVYYGLIWRRVRKIVVVDGLPRNPESLQRLFPDDVARLGTLEEAWDHWQREVLDRLEDLLVPPLFEHYIVGSPAEFEGLAPLGKGESLILEVAHTRGPYVELPSGDPITAGQIDDLAAQAPFAALIACRCEIGESYNEVQAELVRSGARLIPTVGPGVKPDARIAVKVIEALSQSPLRSLVEEQGYFTVGQLLEHFPRQVEIEVEEGRRITYTFRLYVLPQQGGVRMQAFLLASLPGPR